MFDRTWLVEIKIREVGLGGGDDGCTQVKFHIISQTP